MPGMGGMQQGMGMPMQQGMGGMGMPGMGGMQPGMMQGMEVEGPPQQQMAGDGWSTLQQLNSIQIKEKVRWGEVLSELVLGAEIDFANQYMGVDDNDNNLFFFAEQTDFCTRQMKQ